jgi:hypothetical protein
MKTTVLANRAPVHWHFADPEIPESLSIPALISGFRPVKRSKEAIRQKSKIKRKEYPYFGRKQMCVNFWEFIKVIFSA